MSWCRCSLPPNLLPPPPPPHTHTHIAWNETQLPVTCTDGTYSQTEACEAKPNSMTKTSPAFLNLPIKPITRIPNQNVCYPICVCFFNKQLCIRKECEPCRRLSKILSRTAREDTEKKDVNPTVTPRTTTPLR